MVIEPKEGNFKIDDKIVIKCKATLKSHHRSVINGRHGASNHTLNQRQHKPSIYWYKENEILRNQDSNKNKIRHDPEQNKIDETHAHKINIETKQDADENILNSVLTISNAKLDDSGKYRCIYDNIQEQVTVKVIYDCKFLSFVYQILKLKF